MSGAIKDDFPDANTRFAEALDELTQSIETGEALEDVHVYRRPKVDVAALRQRLGLTQQDFADQFGIAIGTLRNWEQGRRVPDGPAQLLRLILEQRPDIALEIFRGQEAHAESLAGSPVKPPEAFRTTREASADLSLPQQVLREKAPRP